MKWRKGRNKKIQRISLDEMSAWLHEQRVVYEGIYTLDGLPQECPWQFMQTELIEQVISEHFSPIEKKLPNTVAMLKARCMSIFACLSHSRWYLLYDLQKLQIDKRPSRTIYSGGYPTTKPQLREAARELGWTVPPELAAFYRVHNGFGNFSLGEDYWNCVLPEYKLTVLGEYFTPDNKIDYDPNEMLEFFPDGAGNGQFFYRSLGESIQTVDWDHETREISSPEGFWEFVDRMLSAVDESK